MALSLIWYQVPVFFSHLQDILIDVLLSGKDAVIMTERQVGLLERFVTFVCLVYARWWIRCPLPAECGLSDLQLLKDIRSYPDDISTAAEKALHLHLWYLTEEQAPRALFSSLLSNDQKEDIRLKLLMYMLALDKDEDGDIEFQFNQRRGSWYGKPVFPESTESYDIVD